MFDKKLIWEFIAKKIQYESCNRLNICDKMAKKFMSIFWYIWEMGSNLKCSDEKLDQENTNMLGVILFISILNLMNGNCLNILKSLLLSSLKNIFYIPYSREY